MRIRPAVFVLLCLVATELPSLAAQASPTEAMPAADGEPAERLLQVQDLEARTQAAATLETGLAADLADSRRANATTQRLADLRVLASEVAALLPAGSQAARRLASATAAAVAHESQDGPMVAATKLRLALADLDSDLRFTPVREAELPKGFPTYAALDEIELRDYPTYRMVRAPMRRNGSMSSFWMLFNHIKKNDIAMTTPVQIDYDHNGEAAAEQSMAFLYGDPAIGEAGKNGKVEVVDVPAVTVLSVGARGYERPDRLATLNERLLRWLAANATEFEAAGTMRMMNYNSPSVGDDRRYFEVQVPVRKVEAKPKAKAREAI